MFLSTTMQLYFGPNHRYFFSDGKGSFRYRATQDFVDLFKNERIAHIYSVAFGEGDDYFISYMDAAGTIRARFVLETHYPKLHSWLFLEGLQHDWSTVDIGLSVDGAFFASSNRGHRWRNLPEDVSDYYQKFTTPDLFTLRRVRSVTFGWKGTYLGIGQNDTWFWDLGQQYPHLLALNVQKEIPRATFVVLNAFAPDQHFAVFQDGTTHYSLPTEWAADIASLFQSYANQTMQASKPSLLSRLSQSSYSSSSIAAPGLLYQQPQQPSTMNQALSLAQSGLDTYNNVTNAGSGLAVGGGFDVNQAMSTMQSSVDLLNQVTGATGGQGVDLVNQIANNGIMVGQVAGQMAGTLTGCSLM